MAKLSPEGERLGRPLTSTERSRRAAGLPIEGPASRRADCATEGPTLRAVNQHRRESQKGPTETLKACPNGCYDWWRGYQAGYKARQREEEKRSRSDSPQARPDPAD